ncbi:MAG: CHAT domain-containing protein [Anaerolineae bacterium]
MKTKTYQDFDLSIEKAGERYRARVLSSPDGPAPPTEFDLPFSDMQLENFILRFGQTRRTMRNIGVAGETVNRSLRDFGGRLYSAIFSGSVADRLHGSLGIVGQQENAGLRIRLRLSDAPELIDVPWEYLFDASAGRFLTLSVDTPVVRYLDMPGQVKPLAVQPPLRILVMLSSPAGYAELNVEQEWQKLKDAVADLERRGLVILERMEKPTLAELQRRLRKQDIHIFHFIGHGGFDEAAQDGVLILETEDGKARPTSGKNLGTILHDEKSVQLAVLNACEGGRTSRHDPFAGVGQSLVQSGIPAVVAMQFEISDQAAITLAHEFYAALADNYPVDAALAEARKAIFAQDNIVEWGTPVLYMRTQDGKVFDVGVAANAPDFHHPHAIVQASTVAVPDAPVPSQNEQVVHRKNHEENRRWFSDLLRHFRTGRTPLNYGIASLAALFIFVAFFMPLVTLHPNWTSPVEFNGKELATQSWGFIKIKSGQDYNFFKMETLFLVPALCILIWLTTILARLRARLSVVDGFGLIAVGSLIWMQLLAVTTELQDIRYESDFDAKTATTSAYDVMMVGATVIIMCGMLVFVQLIREKRRLSARR